MTTTTLPPHGTPGRGRGSRGGNRPACPCPPCRKAAASYNKHVRYLASTGRSRLVDAEPVRKHLHLLIANGDALSVLAEQLGRPRSTLASLANNKRHRITRVLADDILAIRPGRASAHNRSVPSIGSTRRMRALVALGHPVRTIADAAGMEYSTASYLLNGHPDTIHYELTQRVDRAYRLLSETTGTHVRSLRRAQREAFAPPAAWDEESIDDPQARPEWTGYCGTDRGWWSHRQQDIPVCEACDQAHAEWKAEHSHLPRGEFMSRLSASRASASRRGETIAHDGRELLDLGHTFEHAAERLGITTQHLHQELRRHPVVGESEAA